MAMMGLVQAQKPERKGIVEKPALFKGDNSDNARLFRNAFIVYMTENEKYFPLGTGAAEHAQPLDIPYAQLRIMPTVKTGYTFTKGISFVIMAPGTSNLREGVTVWIKNAEGKSADAVVSALVKGIMALSNNPQAFCHEVEA